MRVPASRFQGAILGTAVGDAIGLPREGLSARRARRIFGDPPLRHRLIFGRGMISDDTEHTCTVAQALLSSNGDPSAFACSLAWRLRGWLLGFPAGVGKATAQAILKLWIGFPPSRSGVWSAGNGPAMRAAILGIYAADDLGLLCKLVHASTMITHRDPQAEQGALAIGLAAACGAINGLNFETRQYLDLARTALTDTPMLTLIEAAAAQAEANLPMAEFLESLGMQRGISGYINHTVPAALFCWLRWRGDFRQAVETVVCAGGDADTTGAIVGGLVGATAGVDAIPNDWRDGLWEWPRTVHWMTKLGATLADQKESKQPHLPLPLFWPALLPRNLLFLLIVLLHGLRRLLPPY